MDEERGIFQKPEGTYWVRWRDSLGKQRVKKIGAKVSQAKEYLAKVRDTRRQERLFPEKVEAKRPKLIVADLVERYREETLSNCRSPAHYLRADGLLSEFFGSTPCAQITPADVEVYRAKRLDGTIAPKPRKGTTRVKPEPTSRATCNLDFSRLRSLFNKAIRDGLLDKNPCSRVKAWNPENERIRYLSDDEEVRLQPQLDAPSWEKVEVAYRTGLRAGEQWGLTWPDVDLALGRLRIPKAKGKKVRWVDIGPKVRAILLVRKERQSGPWVFPSAKNPAKKENYHNFYERVFCPALERAAIEGFVWHDLRHTCATRMVLDGVDLITIRDHLGHSSIVVTQRYANIAPSTRKSHIERLG